MDTISLLIEIEVLKKKMDNAEAFLEELIEYIFVVCKDDDYITPEVICRKLYKYGFIDRKDGEWVADTPQTEEPKIRKRINKPFRAVWVDDDHKTIRVVSEESPCTNCSYKESIPCCCCIEYIAWKRKLLRMKGVDTNCSENQNNCKDQEKDRCLKGI